jgi:putative transposase
MTLFRNKYRIETIRKKDWDYSLPGYYYVTICTLDKKHFFGEVRDDIVLLSKIGVVADRHWKEIPSHYSAVSLDAFVVMPNHIHGIIILERPGNPVVLRRTDEILPVPSLGKRSPKPMSLSSIVRSFKAGVSLSCGKLGLEFGWQPRFHDRIIRGPKTLGAIREYIRNNPVNWRLDSLF